MSGGMVSILAVIIILIIAFFAVTIFYLNRIKRRNSIVVAVIDIFSSGNHHIEYLPSAELNRLDLIQLAIGYFASLDSSLPKETEIARDAFFRLQTVVASFDPDSFDAAEYRKHLDDLVRSLSKGTLTGLHHRTVGTSERFKANLIRGKTYDYVLSDFSALGFKPNIGNSAIFLYHNIAYRLDDKALFVLFEAIHRYLDVPSQLKSSAQKCSFSAYHIVQQLRPLL